MTHNPAPLAEWATFYTMIGSSAAALTGLMFVVIGMVMGSRPDMQQHSEEGIHVYSTPTVVHFGATLLASALFLMPWNTVRFPAMFIAIAGALGLWYMGSLIVRAIRLQAYKADLEDWIWYNSLPPFGYAAYIAGGVIALLKPGHGMYVIAGGVVMLLFVAIRNSWDVVTYLAVRPRDDEET